MKHLILLFFIALALASQAKDKRDGLIESKVAVFYPADFDSVENLPSFALVKEFPVTGKIPPNWNLSPNFYHSGEKTIATIPVKKGTSLYGTGEVTGSLLRNGKDITLWNTDNYTYSKDDGKRLYQSHPWVLGVNTDGISFGILADNTWKQQLILGDSIKFISEGPAFRVIVIQENSPQEVLKRLAELTGKIEMPPLWALGFQQCRYSYFPDSRVKEVASEFRKRNIPCDVIWMDIHYMQDFKIFTFDSIRFPDPAGLNAYLHSINFKSVYMIDPGVKKESGYHVYDQGTAGDHWVKTSSGKEFNGNVWPGACAFPDFTRPETCEWWGGLYKNFMATGIDGVWNDMNEPAVFNGPDATMPEDNIHRGGGNLTKDVHLRYHNAYGMMMVKASRDGILKVNPEKRPFVLSRSNYIGGQRYAATWTGDNASTWEHFKMATPMVLNLGLSGQPFCGPDLGGYKGTPDAELFANWISVGAFYPFCRDHTELDGGDQEPWAFGKKVEDISRTALDRRYRLLPYLYTLFHEASVSGLPVMRPVFFADVKDTTLRKEDAAFMWGSDLLIIPKWAKKPTLPHGIWKTVSITGEDSKNDPYQPELKLRGGAIIPLTQLVQSTVDYKTDSLTLLVCLDKHQKAEGKIYTDAGEGFGYQKCEYEILNFKALKKNKNKIAVMWSHAEGNSTDASRNYRIGIVSEKGTSFSDWTQKKTIVVSLKKK